MPSLLKDAANISLYAQEGESITTIDIGPKLAPSME
jgi:hypothetical protein